MVGSVIDDGTCAEEGTFGRMLVYSQSGANSWIWRNHAQEQILRYLHVINNEASSFNKNLKRDDNLKRVKGRMLAVIWRDTRIVNVLCDVSGYLGDGAVRRRDRKEMNPGKSDNQLVFFVELMDGLVAGRSFTRKHQDSSTTYADPQKASSASGRENIVGLAVD
ncbi:hypothetical protein LSH36_147g05047 [Paralvinella palmiformis]|uniref:Uncharacterized protein n=1 Tax=Paralvinella palmiformis TaxID=53620 RepID=A0AAD9NA66_9ANNE|nr:hypothetical protein LSH36_147g05047 [Paralvinella palmiformis]